MVSVNGLTSAQFYNKNITKWSENIRSWTLLFGVWKTIKISGKRWDNMKVYDIGGAIYVLFEPNERM